MPSDLPIISAPDPFERRTTAQKYGSAYYLGIAGLIVVITLISWFATRAWSLRAVWRDIYILHDTHRSEPDRIQAAWRLAHNPNFTPTQAWDIALRKSLPSLARYVIAESLDDAVVRPDPRSYALAAAYSKDWPDWLRLLAARPLLQAAADDLSLPAEAIHELQRHPDFVIATWATATEALRKDATLAEKNLAEDALKRIGKTDPKLRPLAETLQNVIRFSKEDERQKSLAAIDGATIWLRSNDPHAREVWEGWSVDGDDLVQDAASDLPRNSKP